MNFEQKNISNQRNDFMGDEHVGSIENLRKQALTECFNHNSQLNCRERTQNSESATFRVEEADQKVSMNNTKRNYLSEDKIDNFIIQSEPVRISNSENSQIPNFHPSFYEEKFMNQSNNEENHYGSSRYPLKFCYECSCPESNYSNSSNNFIQSSTNINDSKLSFKKDLSLLYNNSNTIHNCSAAVQPSNPLYDVRDLYDNYFSQSPQSENFFNQIEYFPKQNKAFQPVQASKLSFLGSKTEKNFQSITTCIHSEFESRKLIDKARKGEIGMVRRRLTEIEKKAIRPGSVFIYSERGSGIKRWTDSKTWSPSRVLGPFLTYKELQGDLYKKTFTLKFQDNTFHLVAYSRFEWDKDGSCCRLLNKSINRENLFKYTTNENMTDKSKITKTSVKEFEAGY